MADSDDEYDRKRRDKFRGERGSGGDGYRAERRDDRRAGNAGGREEWVERNPFRSGAANNTTGGRPPRPDYRDFSRGPRDRYGSPGRDLPPAKRMRPDWGDDLRGGNPRFSAYDPYIMHAWNEHYAAAAHSMHGPYGHAHAPHTREPAVNNDTLTQPPMLTLKQFLDTQDDGISDSEVLRKYSEYKLDFKRQQLNEFFVTHKDEEWFKNKYHPIESIKRKEEQFGFLKKRVDVFTELFHKGDIKKVTVDTNQSEGLLRLLDTVVIKLEGGTDDDLKILDEKPKEIIIPTERSALDLNNAVKNNKTDNDDDVIITSVTKKIDADDELPKVVTPPRRNARALAGSDEENWDDIDENEDVVKKEPNVDENKITAAVVTAISDEKKSKREKKSLKRKRTRSHSQSSSSSSSSESSSSSSSEDEDDEKLKDKYDLERIRAESAEPENAVAEEIKVKTEVVEDEEDNVTQETTTELEIQSPSSPQVIDKINGAEEDKKSDLLDDMTKAIPDADNEKKIENVDDKNETKETNEINIVTPTIDLDKEQEGPKPRALHRTSSIFLRNLAPSITKAEIENICQRYDGYLRVAIADPLVERRWYRRGWVTFKRDVNIKEYCWNLNNIRIKDCEMGAIVNRDLSRRVRPITGLTAHKSVVRADIKLCAKIAMNLDEKSKLWNENFAAISSDESNQKTNGSNPTTTQQTTNDTSTSFGFKSNNPVLHNITDFLIEEGSAEEEELLGISGEIKDGESDSVEREPQLISVLDALILYLRIVHSVDFYNHCEYPYEDEMPNRCGIIHARGPAPSKITQNDIQDYIRNFESKMQTFLTKTLDIEQEELKNLGSKDAEAEVEKFIQANTQELAKDKWLCPLSGKKFKGPEFIRKHIFNKHGEKVEEVRKEVEFFNNYLKDPKRPQLPEHPGNTKRTNSESGGGGGVGVGGPPGPGGYRPPPMYPPAYPPYGAYAPPMLMPRGGGRGFGMGGGRRGGNYDRQLIQYRDLDAPQDPIDLFN